LKKYTWNDASSSLGGKFSRGDIFTDKDASTESIKKFLADGRAIEGEHKVEVTVKVSSADSELQINALLEENDLLKAQIAQLESSDRNDGDKAILEQLATENEELKAQVELLTSELAILKSDDSDDLDPLADKKSKK